MCEVVLCPVVPVLNLSRAPYSHAVGEVGGCSRGCEVVVVVGELH